MEPIIKKLQVGHTVVAAGAIYKITKKINDTDFEWQDTREPQGTGTFTFAPDQTENSSFIIIS